MAQLVAGGRGSMLGSALGLQQGSGRQGSMKDPDVALRPSAALKLALSGALKLALRCAMVAGITVLPPLPLYIHGEFWPSRTCTYYHGLIVSV